MATRRCNDLCGGIAGWEDDMAGRDKGLKLRPNSRNATKLFRQLPAVLEENPPLIGAFSDAIACGCANRETAAPPPAPVN
jgi:hypothetical protein